MGAVFEISRRPGAWHALTGPGGAFWVLGAETHNSTGSERESLRAAFAKFADHGCNTVLSPVTWELVEPEEGVFRWDTVEWALEAADESGLRWIPLWFGALKNGQSTYAPGWVKLDSDRFPLARGAEGAPLRTLSVFGPELVAADATAFGAFAARCADAIRGGMIPMIQVQNEPGLLGAERDWSAPASAAHALGVPAELGGGTWAGRYGDDADEAFMACGVARYCGAVARAGAGRGVPLFANVWLDAEGQRPGVYPSGGPVRRMRPVWQAMAPEIRLHAPDIYDPRFEERALEFAAPDQPVFVPETGVLHAMGDVGLAGPLLAARAFWLFGEVDSIGISPFGMDSGPRVDDLADAYRVLAPLIRHRAEARPGETMRGFIQGADRDLALSFGGLRALIRFADGFSAERPGCGVLIALGTDRFLLAGRGWSVRFEDATAGVCADFLSAQELRPEGCELRPGRRLNGDDLWGASLQMPERPAVREIVLYRYR